MNNILALLGGFEQNNCTMAFIYRIIQIKNGRSAIGVAASLERLWDRIVFAAGNGEDSDVARAIRRYGPQAFTVALLEECEDQFLSQRIGFFSRQYPDTIVECATRTKGKTILVISPNGVQFQVQNIRRFCRENGLNPSHLCKVLKGSRKSHHGWKAKELENEGTNDQ